MVRKKNSKIDKANTEKKQDTETPEYDSGGNHVEVQGNPVRESGNTYILMCGDKKPKELTNFVMRPVTAIQGENVHMTEIEFTLQNGKRFTEKMDSSVFVSVQKFKTAIKRFGGIEMRFGGNEQNLDDIQKYMNNKYRVFDHCTGVSSVGLHCLEGEWIYVGTSGAIDKKGRSIKDIVSILEDNKALESKITETDMITRKELQELSTDLFRFNTYERTVNIIGWVCACFLKERLRRRRIKLSHLVMAGTAGSGKSETLEKVVQPFFSLSGTGIGCKGLTNFSVLKSTSSTNLLPIIFEEYKPHKLSPAELNTISGMLRSVYDCQTSQRGRADQSVANYARRSPIIVVGESSFDEPAVKERIIDVQFAKSDRTDAHTDSFKALSCKEEHLNKLGKALLMLALNMPDKDLDDLIKRSRIFGKANFESRIILGISNVYLGILFLQTLYESYHIAFEKAAGVTQKDILEAIIKNTMNATDGGRKVKSAVDLIIEQFDTMALKRKIYRGSEYIVDNAKNELCLRINMIYPEFTKYVREFNVQDIEVLTSTQFTKQLRKESYFISYTYRMFKIGDNPETKYKCYVLDLEKLNQICNLEVFVTEKNGYREDDNGFMHVDEDVKLPFEEERK